MLRPAEMLRYQSVIGLVLVVLTGAISCQKSINPGELPREDWLARVGSASIGLDDVVRHLKFQQIDTPEGDVIDVDEPLLQREALDSLIRETLLLQGAKAMRMVVSASDVSQAWVSLREGWGDEELDSWLQARDETVESFREYLKRSLMTARYLNEQVYSRASVRREEVDSELSQLAESTSKPRVRASQIVVPTLEQAKTILKELRRGVKFEAAAREYSITPEAKQGGHLGWFEPEQMPKLYQQCFNMWPGQLSQVLSSEYGFVILKVHERETARNRDTTSVERKRVEEALLYKRKRMLLNEELERLREIYPVERRMTQDSSSL